MSFEPEFLMPIPKCFQHREPDFDSKGNIESGDFLLSRTVIKRLFADKATGVDYRKAVLEEWNTLTLQALSAGLRSNARQLILWRLLNPEIEEQSRMDVFVEEWPSGLRRQPATPSRVLDRVRIQKLPDYASGSDECKAWLGSLVDDYGFRIARVWTDSNP